MNGDTPLQRSSAESGVRATPDLHHGNRVFESLARRIGSARTVEGLHAADAALVFASLYRQSPGPYLWLCHSNREAEEVARNLCFFLPPAETERVLVFPASEGDPYRGLSPHPEISERRALALWKLLRGGFGFVVVPLGSLGARIPSPASFLSHCLRLEVGAFLPPAHLLEKLHETGYVRENPVEAEGEYSSRGGIVDIFSPSHPLPVRVEFFGDEIESMREFDPATQRSIRLVPEFELVPMREVVVTAPEISRWHEEAPRYWSEVRFAAALGELLQFTEKGELFNGFEYLLPLVLEGSQELFQILETSGSPVVILPGPREFLDRYEAFYRNLQATFEERWAAGEPALPPERLFLEPDRLHKELDSRRVVTVEDLALNGDPAVTFDFQVERHYQGRFQELLGDLSCWREAGEQVVFVTTSRGMAERIVDIFREYEIGVHLAEGGFQEALKFGVSATQGGLRQGFYSSTLKLHILTEENVFEERQLRPVVRKAPVRESGSPFLPDFRDLKEGDCVVHLDHGIGIFRGLKRLGVGDTEREFVELMYRDEAKLYVPVEHLDVLQKYSGSGDARPPLDRLGGVSWDRTKQRIKRSMRDLADELLKLYARREVGDGFSFSPDEELMKEFEEAFEFDETPDQKAAIEDVKRDMERLRAMDRLICGDVGYGKTEVAMRATFKAVLDQKQVAVLTPTTVLALQHYNTFRERLRGFPVNVELLSRFRSRKEQKEILQRTEQGLVDVLIGTHRILSRDVKFRDLGLVVLDEEQRFGVAQKEKLKQIRTKVDVLTLSATPIPRTLNMSLIGLRDLSIIETAPKDRLSIQTVVVRFSRNIIRSAIDLELKRQGQVFFLHNSVETIYSMARLVQETVPEARVAVAHGQMRENQLEEVMLDFLNYRYDVLVCTTIIENGLDISRANTLIVNQADRFGLAQLYQLRGRVGRSSQRAYAFFLISSEETLTTEARQRLAAIREFSDLGSGFRIAALDLEIRGAGNLLGGEQHGHINAVGFELYMKLLEQTIRELRGEELEEDLQTSIDLRLDIQIPEHYIDDSSLRLWLYKRISSVPDERSLENLKEEIVDCFGQYPRAVTNLFEYSRLRLKARKLKIVSIDRRGSSVQLRFRPDTPVSAQQVIQLMSSNSGLRLSPDGSVSMEAASPSPGDIFSRLDETLDLLAMVD